MHSIPSRRSPAADAAEAVHLVQSDPRRSQELAEAAREAARRLRDRAAESTAERALGLAARELKDIEAAVSHLRRAVRIGEGADPVTAARARMSLCLVLAYRGDMTGALREADRAATALSGGDAARLQAQRALILQRLGRVEEALEGYRRALDALRRSGDTLWQARLLNNRGLLNGYRGAYREGEADLLWAERLYTALGQDLAVAEVRHNLGFVAGRRGDVPAALAWFDRADAYFRMHGIPRSIYLLDRCEVLLSVRLVPEAFRAAEEAVQELARGGMGADLAEGRLMLSQAALLGGDLGTARREAEEARRAFVAQRRRGWAALASYGALRAAWLGEERSPRLAAAARRASEDLAAAGWAVQSLDARLVAARVALDLGKVASARAELALAGAARKRGPAELRARAWHAVALLRLQTGDRRGAEAALRTGLGALERYRATLGATELRAQVSAHASELASLGLRLALEGGRPERVLAWAERSRAGALRVRPARPAGDVELARDLAELRRVVAEIEQAAFSGAGTARLLRRQAELEEAVRRRSRHAPGEVAGSLVSPPSVAELAAALGDRGLVEVIAADGELRAVVVAGGRARLRSLGPRGEVAAELDALRFALRRLALRRGPARSRRAAGDAAAHAAKRLDDLLLAAVRADVGDRELVVVPTGVLHALPWGVLPSAAGRAVTVAPSATLWLRAAESRPPVRRRVVLVAGPGLPGAASEVEALRAAYPEAAALTGDRAGAEAVARALAGAGLAHVAAHGTVRADNPLFSSLRLADGPLTVYDLEAMPRPPSTLVLSACDSGLSEVRPGDELMGLAGAVLGLGTRTLIASVTLVPDDAAESLMVSFHAALAAGVPPAPALAAAQAGAPGPLAGFVCMGAG